MGTTDFTAEEVGGYIRLLSHQWDKGGLPNDDKRLIKMTGIKSKSLPVVKSKFKLDEDGQLRNHRLEKERDKQIEWRKKSADAGRKSGQVRRNQSSTKGEPTFENGSNQSTNQTPNQKGTLQSSSSSSSSEEVNTVVECKEPFFEMFRRVAGKHINDSELMDEIAKFRNKYPNAHPNQSGALINTWVANIGKEKAIVKDKNSFV